MERALLSSTKRELAIYSSSTVLFSQPCKCKQINITTAYTSHQATYICYTIHGVLFTFNSHQSIKLCCCRCRCRRIVKICLDFRLPFNKCCAHFTTTHFRSSCTFERCFFRYIENALYIFCIMNSI